MDTHLGMQRRALYLEARMLVDRAYSDLTMAGWALLTDRGVDMLLLLCKTDMMDRDLDVEFLAGIGSGARVRVLEDPC
jgi:hypothetical protein